MEKSKILIIDDEENVLNALKRALRQENYDIFTADSAEKALPVIEAQNINLVICDYKLPGIDGIELLEKISCRYPEMINILLTGQADLKTAVEAINRATLYRFVLKPWDDETLQVTIKRALEHRELILKNRFLLNEIKKRDIFLRELRSKYPGIADLKTDFSGRFILD